MLKVRPAEEAEKPLVRALLDSYLLELGAFGGNVFDYPHFRAYWEESERWPYLFDVEGQPAGFCFVNRHSVSGRAVDFFMAEFCILDHYRGQGHGVAAARNIFRRHPGQWELAVLEGNWPAISFWKKAIETPGITSPEIRPKKSSKIFRFKYA